MTNHLEQDTMRGTHGSVALVGVALVIVAWTLGGGRLALGVLVGGAIAAANLWLLSRSVRNLLAGRGASWGGVAAAKFIALLGITYLVLSRPWIDALGFVLGLSALPLGIVAAALLLPPKPPHSERSLSGTRPETDHA